MPDYIRTAAAGRRKLHLVLNTRTLACIYDFLAEACSILSAHFLRSLRLRVRRIVTNRPVYIT